MRCAQHAPAAAARVPMKGGGEEPFSLPLLPALPDMLNCGHQRDMALPSRVAKPLSLSEACALTPDAPSRQAGQLWFPNHVGRMDRVKTVLLTVQLQYSKP